jgi:hypothetical protein
MAVSAKVASRISTQLKKYQSVLRDAKQRDISEADTVTIIKDILAGVLGYDNIKTFPVNTLSAGHTLTSLSRSTRNSAS